MRRAPRRSRAGALDLRATTTLAARCARSREIGPWTVEMLALHGLGRFDVVPAGDLGYLKLVGRLMTGNPRARADEAEVRGFFAPYARGPGWPASTSCAPPRAGSSEPGSSPVQPLAGQELVGQRRRLGRRLLEQPVGRASSARSSPTRRVLPAPRLLARRSGKKTGSVALHDRLLEAAVEARVGLQQRVDAGRRVARAAARGRARCACRKRRSREAPASSRSSRRATKISSS